MESPEADKDTPYSFTSEIRDLEIIEKLNIRRDAKTEERKIDAEKFFELSQNEMWHHNTFLVVIIAVILIYYCFLKNNPT